MFNSKYSKVLTVILSVLVIGIVALVGYVVYDVFYVKSKENNATDVVEKFNNVAKLKKYDNKPEESNEEIDWNVINTVNENTHTNSSQGEKVYMEGYEVMGTIKIKKIGLEYPILERVTTRSLEISVAILYGVGLNNVGNTVIVGHNYRNKLFFSNNKKLSNGDVIEITDQSGNTVKYEIYNMYETSPSDASYMQRDTAGLREISLSTCTDDSSARLIILAKEISNEEN